MKVDGKAGYVVTNDHVIRPPRGQTMRPHISLVFWSGTKQEKAAPAQIVATDSSRDLAVLKVTDIDQFPAPLDLEQKIELTETMTVWILGYPFGELLSERAGNPALTIGRGTISSIRTDERDEMKVVQIDGDLNPGNSGGPVVDSAGRLVGVSVAKITGTRIGLAIPPVELTKMLNGRVGAVGFHQSSNTPNSTQVRVVVTLIDPLAKVSRVTVSYIRSDAVKAPIVRKPDGTWPPLPAAERVDLTIKDQSAEATFLLAAPTGTEILFQTGYTNGEGKSILTQPGRFRVGGSKSTDVAGASRPPGAATSPIPTPSPAEITPPAVTEKVVVRTPASLADLAGGGGGRYLIVHLPKLRQLGIFDANAAKIVKYIPVAEDRIKFAAGMDKLVIVLPQSRVLQRWSLQKLEREKSVPLPISEDVKQILLGSASAGPLVLNSTFIDLDTLKVFPVDTEKAKIPYGEGDRVRVSADGKVFGRWVPDSSPQQNQVYVLEGGMLALYGLADASVGHTNPGPDGKVIFTGRGLFTTQGKPIGVVGHPKGEYCLPAHHGDYYVKLTPKYKLALMRVGDDRPIVGEITGIDLIEGINAWDREAFTNDKRIHLIPRAKLLVTIPATNDQLILHRFDPDEALEKSRIEYLFVTSQPVTMAKKGTLYKYLVTVKSKKGGIRYNLDSAPPEMKLSAAGELAWHVPASFAEKEAQVIIRITDAGGNEAFHTFTLTVE
jgi:hypothetical protein